MTESPIHDHDQGTWILCNHDTTTSPDRDCAGLVQIRQDADLRSGEVEEI